MLELARQRKAKSAPRPKKKSGMLSCCAAPMTAYAQELVQANRMAKKLEIDIDTIFDKIDKDGSGMLDRFDSYFFAFPLAYLYVDMLAIFEK